MEDSPSHPKVATRCGARLRGNSSVTVCPCGSKVNVRFSQAVHDGDSGSDFALKVLVTIDLMSNGFPSLNHKRQYEAGVDGGYRVATPDLKRVEDKVKRSNLKTLPNVADAWVHGQFQGWNTDGS